MMKRKRMQNKTRKQEKINKSKAKTNITIKLQINEHEK